MKCIILRLATSALAAVLFIAAAASAQIAPPLGSAQSFAVLGATAVTNTGPTIVTGELGISPGTAVTGFGPGVVMSGSIHSADAAANAAQSSLTIAYDNLSGQACDVDLTGQDLGGLILTPAVYCFSSTAQLTGTLTLNAEGNANAVFIFKIGSALTTASGSSVVLTNPGSACNVFWQVGSSATLGTGTAFVGTILAQSSITANTNARITGRTLARNGAVTLDTSAVTVTCAAGPLPPTCPVIPLSPATLPGGTVGIAYSQAVSASGGVAPYSFAVASGLLPPGVTLTAAGMLIGTPTTAGSSPFTIRGTAANQCSGTASYTITVAAAPLPPAGCPAIGLAPLTLPNGTVGVAYNETLLGSGGTAPYSFGVTGGVLPAGVTLTAAGVMAGTPGTAGPSSFSVRATDANGCFATVTYSVVIAAAPTPPGSCPAITLSPETLSNGMVGAAYSQTIVGSGGTAPYTFGVTGGALPAGVTLTAGGLLSGTPTTAGPVSVTIRGTDANGCFVERSFTIAIPTEVPTLPETFVVLLALGLVTLGYFRLRRRTGLQ